MNSFLAKRKSSTQIGRAIEDLACLYLKNANLKLLLRNYRCSMGEIDLVMQDNQCLVFVEVRYRSQINYGSSLESINNIKQSKLIKTAQHYLLRHKVSSYHTRFDVVAIDKVNNIYNIFWLKNAIEMN